MVGPEAFGVQPDARSCGAACVVAARAEVDAAYAAALADPERWRAEVLAAHRAVTGLVDGGRVAAPWPRALGTPPWAVARRLRAVTGAPYRVRWLRRPAPALPRAAVAAVAPSRPVAVFVGSRLLPRHVVLLVARGDGVAVYDPARGAVTPLDRSADLRSVAGWPRAWCWVGVPRTP